MSGFKGFFSIQNSIFFFLIVFFFFLSYSPTLLNLSYKDNLLDKNREFVLEHNYYWPDFNLYLSKIRQGYKGNLFAKERYTTEEHTGSLIQWLYVLLGISGKALGLSVPWSYQMGRLLFAPLAMIVILLFIRRFFTTFPQQLGAFIIVLTSGSFPRLFTDASGITHIGRYMEWWSNMDALQRITHLPHILAAQAISFFLLYKLLICHSCAGGNPSHGSRIALLSMQTGRLSGMTMIILLGNFLGLIFPPSLMTLHGVIALSIIVPLIQSLPQRIKNQESTCLPARQGIKNFKFIILNSIFLLLTLPSLLYIFFLTKTVPWSALVDAHKMTRMPLALDQFVLATGPIFFLAIAGIITLIIQRKKSWYPLIYFVVSTFLLASYFSIITDQSPLRFTQTGLFIPLGMLGAYFLITITQGYKFLEIRIISLICYMLFVFFFLTISLIAIKSSYDWQKEFFTSWARADHPAVPYPPQSLPPLTSWMDAIRFLENNTDDNDVVIAQITAANYIPAYAGNTVWWGQTNTYDYFRKQKLMEEFFKGTMTLAEAKHLMAEGKIKYIFVGPQEKEMLTGKNITDVYPFLKIFFDNKTIQIYTIYEK